MWQEFAAKHGYTMFISRRTNSKADGCCVLIRQASPNSKSPRRIELRNLDGIDPEDSTSPGLATLSYNDWGDRIVQLVGLTVDGAPVTLLHTHLTFPHPSLHDGPMRLHQARKLAECVRRVRAAGTPAIVCGDLNGDHDDPAVTELLRRGGMRPMPNAADEAWASHVAHNGRVMACDMALTSGDCAVESWRLGGTEAELLARRSLSDHRPLHITVSVGG
uniref:Endonuclease/exonuclease/phosphatase domain-containing protein n=2 Tax=Chrysotila carterae TaxID=13221 RepID=A0A7S4B766_CHRCT